MREHRIRVKGEQIEILEEALKLFLKRELEEGRGETETFRQAFELYDRVNLLRMGFRPKGGRPRKVKPNKNLK